NPGRGNISPPPRRLWVASQLMGVVTAFFTTSFISRKVVAEKDHGESTQHSPRKAAGHPLHHGQTTFRRLCICFHLPDHLSLDAYPPQHPREGSADETRFTARSHSFWTEQDRMQLALTFVRSRVGIWSIEQWLLTPWLPPLLSLVLEAEAQA